jgi:hypothetical protein
VAAVQYTQTILADVTLTRQAMYYDATLRLVDATIVAIWKQKYQIFRVCPL